MKTASIEPNYQPEEIIEVLKSSGLFALLALLQIGRLATNEKVIAEVDELLSGHHQPVATDEAEHARKHLVAAGAVVAVDQDDLVCLGPGVHLHARPCENKKPVATTWVLREAVIRTACATAVYPPVYPRSKPKKNGLAHF